MAEGGGSEGDRPAGMLTIHSRIGFGKRYACALLTSVLLVSGSAPFPNRVLAANPPGQEHAPGQAGYLVIEAARDTSAGFRWEPGPGPRE